VLLVFVLWGFCMGIFEGIVALVDSAKASQLALASFLSVAVAGMAYAFFYREAAWVKLVAFTGVLAFAFSLCIKLIVPPVAKIDQTNLLELLVSLPTNARLASCLSGGRSPELCKQAVDSIAVVPSPQISADLKEEVTSALERGTVSTAVLERVGERPKNEDKVVTYGNAQGWDVDAFWCRGGPNEASARAQAERVAKVLASAGPLAPGVAIGRVRVRALDAGKPGYPKPGDGGFISVDQMRGKPEAVAAIRAKLNSDAGLSYADRFTKSGLPTYISLFECRGGLSRAIPAGQIMKN
jgi:hypothetical protein